MKIAMAAVAAFVAVAILIGGIGQALVWALFGGGGTEPNPEAVADIPPDYLAHYRAAAKMCPGLDWSTLAAIGKIESDHGRSRLPGVHNGENKAGAGGPMQFKAATFAGVIARHQLPTGGATPPSRYNPQDAIYAAAHNLCDNGIHRGDLRAAIFAYNPANWYVNDVLSQAARYSQSGTGNCTTTQPPNPIVAQAIAWACDQLGIPYVWGGNGPQDGGFDCSGLTKAAYASAGISIPRTAHTQYNAGPRLPTGTPLLPGDLVFYGNGRGRITHVGIAISSNQMINAPYTGTVVRIDAIGRYVGATRPTDNNTSR